MGCGRGLLRSGDDNERCPPLYRGLSNTRRPAACKLGATPSEEKKRQPTVVSKACSTNVDCSIAPSNHLLCRARTWCSCVLRVDVLLAVLLAPVLADQSTRMEQEPLRAALLCLRSR